MMDDAGKFLLRITLGVLLLLHGIAKIKGGVSGIEGMVTGAGMPGFLAWGAYIGEALAPLLVIVGFYSRIGALLIVVNMLFAIALAHTKDLFVLGQQGGWALELQGFFLFTALAIMLMGPGRWSINRR
jgi:putative oxidoreductase